MNPAIMIVVIVGCYDGDTCTADREILPGRDRIRIENIDAPEISGRCWFEIGMAQHARDWMRAAVVGRIVEVTNIRADRYPRRVDARVRLDGVDVGESIVAAGLARPWRGHREEWCK